MSQARYTEEFKAEAVVQILERGYSVKEVSERIGVCTYSLYKWIKKDSRNPASGKAVKKQLDAEDEVVRLKAELKRCRRNATY